MIFHTQKTKKLKKTTNTHGMWGTPTYISWHKMKQRCTNERCDSCWRYGGAGIGLCDKWVTFEGFYEDMGERPPGTQIDRIDSCKGYYKENCRWATLIINAYNRKRSIKSNLPRGVSKSGKRFRAFITIQYVQYSLGSHDTPELAHEEYRKVAMEWFGFIPHD